MLKRYKDDVDTGTGFESAACIENAAVYIDFGDKFYIRDVGRPLIEMSVGDNKKMFDDYGHFCRLQTLSFFIFVERRHSKDVINIKISSSKSINRH